MSHATADLEYFKCDLCGVYLHKDIFCDHRRDCKGLNSTELKKSECRMLEEQVSMETRRLIAAREAVAAAAGGIRGGGSASTPTTEAAAAGSEVAQPSPNAAATDVAAAAAPRAGTNVLLSTAQLEKREQDRVRRRIADEYHTQKERELEQRLRDEKRRQELLDFLES